MTTRKQLLAAAAAVAVVVGAGSTVWLRHNNQASSSAKTARATMVADADIERAVQDSKLPVSGLVVRSVGDIVVLKGNAPDAATIESAARVVKGLGVQRVANMIQIPTAPNDDAIRREAERQLTQTRALDGCRLTVSCERGVLRVTGRVGSELQQDTVRALLRAVNGVQKIETDLTVATEQASR
ncbi:MAG TPA: BON domain-containing protein [Thermoanaerobaculia bacterium]|jgi:osmotically-inducible protein OsmY|nr:BON domain-containing protein [Thermoanaerobaculia bacterium]